jgi:hypothetical protein
MQHMEQCCSRTLLVRCLAHKLPSAFTCSQHQHNSGRHGPVTPLTRYRQQLPGYLRPTTAAMAACASQQPF